MKQWYAEVEKEHKRSNNLLDTHTHTHTPLCKVLLIKRLEHVFSIDEAEDDKDAIEHTLREDGSVSLCFLVLFF